MCGIFGWTVAKEIGRPERRRLATVAAVLAAANDRRGGDSWGVYADGDCARGLGRLAVAGVAVVGRLAARGVVMAHTRKATTGKVAVANAHPFEVKHLVGAHNGIVFNHEELNRRYGRRCAVDSEHLFHHLADGLPLGDIDAYGAIQYVDARQPGVWLAAFNGGDLAATRLPFGVAWSSDEDDLAAALSLAGLEHTPYRVDQENLYRAADQLYDHKDRIADWPEGWGFSRNRTLVDYTRGRGSWGGWDDDEEEEATGDAWTVRDGDGAARGTIRVGSDRPKGLADPSGGRRRRGRDVREVVDVLEELEEGESAYAFAGG